MGRRFLKTVVLAACLLAGTVAVAGQESSTGTDVQPEPTRESSTGVTPEPTPRESSSTGVPERARESSSSTGVNPEPARSSSSSTGDVRPSDMSSSSSGAYDSFSTGAAPFTTGICDQLTTKLGYNNRDSQNEVTVLDQLITTAFLGSSDTQNGIKVGGIVNSVILKPYFDGSINYRQNGPVRSPYAKSASPDYTKDTTELTRLKNKLIAFFGQQAALGCSAEGFPTYALVGDDEKNYNQFQAHYNMNISATEFTLFNAQIINSAKYYGASDSAQTAVANKLAAFGRTNIAGANQNEICHMDSCPCAFGVQGTNCDGQVSAASSSFQASFVSLAVVAAGALLAMAL